MLISVLQTSLHILTQQCILKHETIINFCNKEYNTMYLCFGLEDNLLKNLLRGYISEIPKCSLHKIVTARLLEIQDKYAQTVYLTPFNIL